MVIVDVQNRATGIPTDAYLAIEEIKDVRQIVLCAEYSSLCQIVNRTEQKRKRLSYMCHQR